MLATETHMYRLYNLLPGRLQVAKGRRPIKSNPNQSDMLGKAFFIDVNTLSDTVQRFIREKKVAYKIIKVQDFLPKDAPPAPPVISKENEPAPAALDSKEDLAAAAEVSQEIFGDTPAADPETEEAGPTASEAFGTPGEDGAPDDGATVADDTDGADPVIDHTGPESDATAAPDAPVTVDDVVGAAPETGYSIEGTDDADALALVAKYMDDSKYTLAQLKDQQKTFGGRSRSRSNIVAGIVSNELGIELKIKD